MKQYPLKTFVTASAVALVAAVGLSAPASAATTAAERAKAERFLAVSLNGQSVGCGQHAVVRGRTTLVVRNTRATSESFVLARHSGGLLSLPRFEGMPFVPPGEIVTRLHRIGTDKQQRIAVTLQPGTYLLVATPRASGTIFVDEAMSFRVT